MEDKKEPVFLKIIKVLAGIGVLVAVIFVAFLKVDMKAEKPKAQKARQLQTIQQAPAKQNENALQGVEVKVKKEAAAKKEAVKAVVKKTPAKPTQQLFPAEKILTISAFEYCENHGKNIKDYEMVGVHGYSNYLFDRKDLLSGYAKRLYNNDHLSSLLIRRIPPGTEVVVRLAYSSADDIASGVALIPKPKQQKQPAIKPAVKKSRR
ncbi:hypothetical protein HYT26_04020 [Candidatus Pacearchaeota archaeon]|nr:hypothetical protein [Candidatus Pacearchaeota archaeon]